MVTVLESAKKQKNNFFKNIYLKLYDNRRKSHGAKEFLAEMTYGLQNVKDEFVYQSLGGRGGED